MAGRAIILPGADAGASWAASCAAVEAVCGEKVPLVAVRRAHGRYFTRRQARLRKLGVYVAVCGLGVPALHMAGRVGLAYSTVRAWLHDIEDLRDDPGEDALVDRLCEAAALWLAAGGTGEGPVTGLAA